MKQKQLAMSRYSKIQRKCHPNSSEKMSLRKWKMVLIEWVDSSNVKVASAVATA